MNYMKTHNLGIVWQHNLGTVWQHTDELYDNTELWNCNTTHNLGTVWQCTAYEMYDNIQLMLCVASDLLSDKLVIYDKWYTLTSGVLSEKFVLSDKLFVVWQVVCCVTRCVLWQFVCCDTVCGSLCDALCACGALFAVWQKKKFWSWARSTS